MEDNQECCRRSFAASLKDSAKEVLKNPKLVPRQVRKDRLKVCHECDHYIEDKDQCDVCLCFMSIKASFEAMDCPLGRWPENGN
jgi:hypothetical protein